MIKRLQGTFVVLLVGLLLLAACGGADTGGGATGGSDTTGVTDSSNTGTRVKENAAMGSAPQIPVEGADEGPADRGAAGVTSDAAAACLSPVEGELARMVNEYRASLNLPPVQISKSLTLVAQQHAWDSTTNGTAWPAPPAGKTCNMHSWTDRVNPALQQGTWTAVCYTSDHANMSGMHRKPGELAGYPGDGVENSFAASNGATPSGALTGWKNSRGHNAVITEQDGWTRPAAMGVGINGNFAHLWFGYVADPAGEALLCSGGSAMQPPPATVAPTAVPPTATTAPATAAPTDPAATAAPTAQPTAVPPTTAPTTAPTGEVLNQTGTIAAGATTNHTFNVAPGRTYTVVISPSATLDVDPQYECSTANSSASGGFDWNWEGIAETFTYTATGDGTCTITIAGYGGTTGTYTITATAR